MGRENKLYKAIEALKQLRDNKAHDYFFKEETQFIEAKMYIVAINEAIKICEELLND